MTTLTLAQHTKRLLTCLIEASAFAQTTSPGTGHNAGMWQAAITEAQAALDAEADLATLRGAEVRELRREIADLSGALATIESRHSFCFNPTSRDVATAQEAARALRQAQEPPSATEPIQQPPSAPAPAYADLAPAMLDLLRRLLDLYDGRRLAPPETFAAYWGEVRELISQAEEVS